MKAKLELRLKADFEGTSCQLKIFEVDVLGSSLTWDSESITTDIGGYADEAIPRLNLFAMIIAGYVAETRWGVPQSRKNLDLFSSARTSLRARWNKSNSALRLLGGTRIKRGIRHTENQKRLQSDYVGRVYDLFHDGDGKLQINESVLPFGDVKILVAPFSGGEPLEATKAQLEAICACIDPESGRIIGPPSGRGIGKNGVGANALEKPLESLRKEGVTSESEPEVWNAVTDQASTGFNLDGSESNEQTLPPNEANSVTTERHDSKESCDASLDTDSDCPVDERGTGTGAKQPHSLYCSEEKRSGKDREQELPNGGVEAGPKKDNLTRTWRQVRPWAVILALAVIGATAVLTVWQDRSTIPATTRSPTDAASEKRKFFCEIARSVRELFSQSGRAVAPEHRRVAEEFRRNCDGLIEEGTAANVSPLELSALHLESAHFSRCLGEAETAIKSAENALRLSKIVDASESDNSDQILIQAKCHSFIGNLHHEAGQLKKAQESYSQSIELVAPLAGSETVDKGIRTEIMKILLSISVQITGDQTFDNSPKVLKLLDAVAKGQFIETKLPQNVELLEQHSVVCFELARSNSAQGDTTQALEYLNEAWSTGDALVKAGSGDPAYAGVQALAEMNRGVLFTSLGMVDGNKDGIKKARDELLLAESKFRLLMTLYDSAPIYKGLHADCLLALGRVAQLDKQWNEANSHLTKARTAFGHLLSEFKGCDEWNLSYAQCCISLGNIQQETASANDGRLMAYDVYKDGLDRIKQVSNADAHQRLRRNLEMLLRYNIAFLRFAGKETPDDALSEIEKACQIGEQLVDQFPGNQVLRLDVATLLMRAGATFQDAGKTKEAEKYLRMSADLHETLDAQRGHSAERTLVRAKIASTLADIYISADQPLDAVDAISRACDFSLLLPETMDADASPPRPVVESFFEKRANIREIIGNKTEAVSDWSWLVRRSGDATTGTWPGRYRLRRAIAASNAGQYSLVVSDIRSLRSFVESQDLSELEAFDRVLVVAQCESGLLVSEDNLNSLAIECLRDAVNRGFSDIDVLKRPEIRAALSRIVELPEFKELEAKIQDAHNQKQQHVEGK